MTATIPAQEQALLTAARAGDEHAYTRLIEPRRRELHAHCYRMLGSVHDADDALQDTLLRAWRGLPRFAGRSSLRTWLHTIAHNACLAIIERRPRRALPVDVGPAFDPADIPARVGDWMAVEGWIEPYPDEVGAGLGSPSARYERRESVELAFVAAVQLLPPNQRAALIMRDVLGFSARETATALEASVPSVNSALQRARATVDARLPEENQQVTLRSLGDERVRRLVEAYTEAWERGDAEAILALLASDATFSMPPYELWFQGHEDIRGFLLAAPLQTRWRCVPAVASGQIAFGFYQCEDGRFLAHSVDVVRLGRDGTVRDVTAFLDGTLLAALRLPPEVPARPGVGAGTLVR
jgi:RNA polymerase sigma-70 factor (ECF subfamily)